MKTFIDTINFGVKNWWVSLLLGLLYILIAICLMFTPLASYVALSVLFSVSMFVSGTLEILFAVTNRKNISSWGWYLASGIMAFGVLAILCSIGIIWQPGLGALSLVYMIAYTLLIIGIFRVMLSFELKSLHKRNKEYNE